MQVVSLKFDCSSDGEGQNGFFEIMLNTWRKILPKVDVDRGPLFRVKDIQLSL
jgi:hypothetical protein